MDGSMAIMCLDLRNVAEAAIALTNRSAVLSQQMGREDVIVTDAETMGHQGLLELTSAGTYRATEGPQSTLHSPGRSCARLSPMATGPVVTPDFSLKDPDSLQATASCSSTVSPTASACLRRSALVKQWRHTGDFIAVAMAPE